MIVAARMVLAVLVYILVSQKVQEYPPCRQYSKNSTV